MGDALANLASARQQRLPTLRERLDQEVGNIASGGQPAEGGSESVPVLFVEAAHEAYEGFLIIHRGARGVGIKPIAEILMERLIIPAWAIRP